MVCPFKFNPIWSGLNYEQSGPGGGGQISPRLISIKYHLYKLQSIAMALYKSHAQYCSGMRYVANSEIGLVLAEIIAGLSREVMLSIFFIYLCQL